jgi:hypothetical protein
VGRPLSSLSVSALLKNGTFSQVASLLSQRNQKQRRGAPICGLRSNSYDDVSV